MEFYKGYHVISTKIVREKEKYLEIYFTNQNGTLKKTNRGYFLDGRNISCTSAERWKGTNVITNKVVYDHGRRII